MVATFLAILELVKAKKLHIDGEGEGSVVEKTGDIENIDEFISNTGGDIID